MKARAAITAAAIVTVLVMSTCHSLTEYQGTLHAGVVFVRADDFSVEAVIEGFDDGRAICSIDSRTFYVVSSTGTLFKVDSEEMALDTTISVWTGLATAPVDIVSPLPRSKVYVMGSNNNIVEVGVSSDQVTDVFQPGPSPSCMAVTRQYTNARMYIGDLENESLIEVDVSTNTNLRYADIGNRPYAIAADNASQFLLASSFYDDTSRIMNIGLDPIHAGQRLEYLSGTDIVVPEGSSHFFMADPRWGSGGGTVYAITVDTLGGADVDQIPMPGHPVRVASSPNGHFLYVLSNTGDGNAVLTEYDLWSSGYRDVQLEIDGYPWDLTVHADGEYVLVLIAN
jgi:hypothetical protein